MDRQGTLGLVWACTAIIVGLHWTTHPEPQIAATITRGAAFVVLAVAAAVGIPWLATARRQEAWPGARTWKVDTLALLPGLVLLATTLHAIVNAAARAPEEAYGVYLMAMLTFLGAFLALRVGFAQSLRPGPSPS